jgi:hypothetical protein
MRRKLGHTASECGYISRPRLALRRSRQTQALIEAFALRQRRQTDLESVFPQVSQGRRARRRLMATREVASARRTDVDERVSKGRFAFRLASEPQPRF